MRKKGLLAVVSISAVLILTLVVAGDAMAAKRYVFGGGPAGGVFQVVANAIQVYDPIKNNPDFVVRAQSSGGSTENLRTVNAGRVHFGSVYAGEVFLGRNGRLSNDPNKYENVLAVTYLYGAPAQLVVRQGSGIKSVKDLEGKKVGVGNAGSGAFANCELFFTHMGIWDKIQRNAMGYDDAAQAFGNEQLDAFWLFVGFPAGAVMMAAQTNDIALVGLHKDAEESGYYEKFPYFAKVTLPPGTYKGVDEPVDTFQDSTLWVANADVPEDVVYTILTEIFSPEGLQHMVAQNKNFKEMSIENGIKGISTPMHPGAEKFWREKGVLK
jgi:TRAP transporter TAXI family solute receptor